MADGLLLNIPALEAAADLRHLWLIGAAFGGREGKAYIDLLSDLAYYEEPDTADASKTAFERGEARWASPPPPPDQAPEN